LKNHAVSTFPLASGLLTEYPEIARLSEESSMAIQIRQNCLLLVLFVFTSTLFFLAAGVHGGQVSVSIEGKAFHPSQVTVSKGDTVAWTNKGDTTHTVTSGSDCSSSGEFNHWLAPRESFSYTFEKKGEFPYFSIPFCQQNMTGTVVVE
jgi:plastocyanin